MDRVFVCLVTAGFPAPGTCLAHSRYSTNICGMNEQMNKILVKRDELIPASAQSIAWYTLCSKSITHRYCCSFEEGPQASAKCKLQSKQIFQLPDMSNAHLSACYNSSPCLLAPPVAPGLCPSTGPCVLLWLSLSLSYRWGFRTSSQGPSRPMVPPAESPLTTREALDPTVWFHSVPHPTPSLPKYSAPRPRS